jgi:isopentenyldiphosphate isomerase
LWCPGCNKIIQLTNHPVDPMRYARVHGPAPVEHPDIVQLRHQQEIERIRRQYQEELERERRQARAKQMSSDIEILAEKISTTKQFELDALAMVKKLKDAGTLEPDEEAILKELIKDKVMEEFHVDRRGGRTRYQP